MRTHSARRSLTVAVAISMLGAVLVTAAPSAASTASAASTCHRWASSTGDDANDGTRQDRAFATLGTLAAALGAGETGCIPAGDRFIAHSQGVIGAVSGTPERPVTITSGPGGRATIQGGLLFNSRSHDIVFTNLIVRGDGFTGNAIHVEGRSILLSDLDVSHPVGICVGVGKLDAYAHQYTGIEARDVTISRSRIHGCGVDPSLAPRWADDRFSGSHGIYVVNAVGTLIVENAIYDNKYRGVQLFPRALDTTVARNVFDRNATHVNVGSTLPDGYPWRSSGAVIRDNVMSNRVTTFRVDKNPAQVHGYLPKGAAADGNVVVGNCMVDEPGVEVSGYGIEVGANTVGVARYVNSAAKDFRQATDSPCRAFGPTWSRPEVAGSHGPVLTCAASRAVLTLPRTVTTPSRDAGWAYSRIWYRLDGGAWQHRTWYAAQANTGAAVGWWYQAPGTAWAQVGPEVAIGVRGGTVEAWEQRYELVGGAWTYEWHYGGSCAAG